MAGATEVYVDTSALIAFLDRSDTYHQLFLRLFSDPPRLLTTSLVVVEVHGWFLRRYDPARALQFLAVIEAMKPLKIAPVGAREVRSATDTLRRYADQQLTVADAVGLDLMAARQIRLCWSTDFHLGLNGVPLVIHHG